MKRREVLGSLAAAGLVAALPASGQQAARPQAGAPAGRIARKGRIKQGLWRINFGADTELSFDDMCREAARLGCYGFDLIDPADWPTLRKHGLEPLLAGAGPRDLRERRHSPGGAQRARGAAASAYRHVREGRRPDDHHDRRTAARACLTSRAPTTPSRS